MTTDIIAAARAMIEPLTGYTPRPWHQGRNNPDRVSKGGEYIANCNPTHQSHPRNESNARLIAAAPELRDMVATLADALEAEQAKVAAAYEAAACVTVDMGPRYDGRSVHYHIPERVKGAIRALTPADAQAALDKMLAEARLAGWRAGRDVAADEAATYDCSGGSDDFTCGFHSGYRDAVQQIVEGIRDAPEPKEANHD